MRKLAVRNREARARNVLVERVWTYNCFDARNHLYKK